MILQYISLVNLPPFKILLVMASLHLAVIAHLSNPLMLCAFLTRSYDIGGVVTVMALSSIFILMKQHGLEHPYFYEKLYALVQPSIFIAKHRVQFYELLCSCLESSLLPAYLAPAFAEKQSRLAPSVLNLIRRHPSSNCLVPKKSSKEKSTKILLQSHPLHLLLLASMLSATVPVALGEVGTASYYIAPYEPTECYAMGASQFPSDNLFAAVNDELWDGGAACGREYLVRCAVLRPGTCKPGTGWIKIKIVDYALSPKSAAAAFKQSVPGAKLVLSRAAFEAIANPSMDLINIEFKEV